MRIFPMMIVKVGISAHLNAYDTSMSLLGAREVEFSCNTHGKPLDTRRTAPCFSNHVAARIADISLMHHASSALGVALCPGW